MFDSPLEWCPICNNWVALDQTFAECARQHGCSPGRCPLASLLECWKSAAPVTTAGASRESGLGVG